MDQQFVVSASVVITMLVLAFIAGGRNVRTRLERYCEAQAGLDKAGTYWDGYREALAGVQAKLVRRSLVLRIEKVGEI